jgi:formate hydrogenlyase subunit 3/multisubunit Na+/H+ antiporter MnhD subunit
MIGWVARGLLVAAGFVASWFITRDVPQFGLAQGAVALVLLVFVVAVLAFWPAQWTTWISQPARHRLNIRWQLPKRD